VAILKNKAAQLGFILSDEIANYIASKITANVRQLEGTVKKIKAFKDLDGVEVNTATVDRALQYISRSSEFIITPDSTSSAALPASPWTTQGRSLAGATTPPSSTPSIK